MYVITAKHSLDLIYKELQVNKKDLKQKYWSRKLKGNS